MIIRAIKAPHCLRFRVTEAPATHKNSASNPLCDVCHVLSELKRAGQGAGLVELFPQLYCWTGGCSLMGIIEEIQPRQIEFLVIKKPNKFSKVEISPDKY